MGIIVIYKGPIDISIYLKGYNCYYSKIERGLNFKKSKMEFFFNANRKGLGHLKLDKSEKVIYYINSKVGEEIYHIW